MCSTACPFAQLTRRGLQRLHYQNRVGSKFGGGGPAGASEANVDRRERLRKLALETIDISSQSLFGPACALVLHLLRAAIRARRMMSVVTDRVALPPLHSLL